MNKTKGIIFSFLASISIALSNIFLKMSVDVMSVETSNTLWFLSATIMFLIFFVVSGKINYIKIIIKNWRKIAPISLFVSLGGVLFSYGVLYSGPTNAAFINQFTTVFTILLGVSLLKERCKRLELVGIVISIIGVFVLSYGNISVNPLSILLLLGSSLFFSLSNFISKVHVKNIKPVTLAGGRSFIIFLFILTYSTLSGRLEFNFPITSIVFPFLGALCGAFVGFILFYKALDNFEVSKSMSIRTIEPFLTAIFYFLILSSIPTPNQLLGGTLIVLGIVILIITKQR